jgi:hypothetical protein
MAKPSYFSPPIRQNPSKIGGMDCPECTLRQMLGAEVVIAFSQPKRQGGVE